MPKTIVITGASRGIGAEIARLAARQGYAVCINYRRNEAVLRLSPKRGGQGGAIVNVSSAASRTGSPGEYVDYATPAFPWLHSEEASFVTGSFIDIAGGI